MQRNVPSLLAALLISSVYPFTNALPATFEEGNIVVNTGGVLYEYTASGDLVQSVPIPYPSGSITESARDVAVVHPGFAAVYNGTFSPYLSLWDAAAESWNHRAHPGWSTVNNASYGGIASHQQYVFATDMRTFGGGEAKGIVRFDLDSSTAVRFATNIEPIDLNLGLDGLLYALYPGGSPEGRHVDVYEPDTLSFVRTIDLSAIFGHTGHRSIAVNDRGEMFIADWDGDLQKTDAAGNLLLQTNLCGIAASCSLYDVDVSIQGLVVVGDRFGGVTVTDEDFASPTSFIVGWHGVFVGTVPFRLIPPTIIVENQTNVDGCVEAENPAGATITLRGESQNPDPVLYSWTSSSGETSADVFFSLDVGVDESVDVILTITNDETGDMSSSEISICVSDTTPPSITILSPQEGSTFTGNNLVVQVTISDAVDLQIESFDLFVGNRVTLPNVDLEVVSFRVYKPGAGRPVETEILVTARDDSGNEGEASVVVWSLHDRRPLRTVDSIDLFEAQPLDDPEPAPGSSLERSDSLGP